MRDIVNMVLEESNSELIPVEIETSKRYGNLYEDIPRRVPDVSKAEKLLNWVPSTSAREGISKTISWAKDNPWYLK